MNHDIVGCRAMVVTSLDCSGSRLPDLYGAVFRARHHPFSLAVKGNASDVAGVALEGQYGGRVCVLDIVELDSFVAGSGKVSLIGGDA